MSERNQCWNANTATQLYFFKRISHFYKAKVFLRVNTALRHLMRGGQNKEELIFSRQCTSDWNLIPTCVLVLLFRPTEMNKTFPWSWPSKPEVPYAHPAKVPPITDRTQNHEGPGPRFLLLSQAGTFFVVIANWLQHAMGWFSHL